MMGYEDIMNSYKFITYVTAKTLHLGDKYGIKENNPANFIIINAENFYDALNKKDEILFSYHNGKLVAKTNPVIKEVFIKS